MRTPDSSTHFKPQTLSFILFRSISPCASNLRVATPLLLHLRPARVALLSRATLSMESPPNRTLSSIMVRTRARGSGELLSPLIPRRASSKLVHSIVKNTLYISILQFIHSAPRRNNAYRTGICSSSRTTSCTLSLSLTCAIPRIVVAPSLLTFSRIFPAQTLSLSSSSPSRARDEASSC